MKQYLALLLVVVMTASAIGTAGVAVAKKTDTASPIIVNVDATTKITRDTSGVLYQSWTMGDYQWQDPRRPDATIMEASAEQMTLSTNVVADSGQYGTAYAELSCPLSFTWQGYTWNQVKDWPMRVHVTGQTTLVTSNAPTMPALSSSQRGDQVEANMIIISSPGKTGQFVEWVKQLQLSSTGPVKDRYADGKVTFDTTLADWFGNEQPLQSDTTHSESIGIGMQSLATGGIASDSWPASASASLRVQSITIEFLRYDVPANGA